MGGTSIAGHCIALMASLAFSLCVYTAQRPVQSTQGPFTNSHDIPVTQGNFNPILIGRE